MKRILFFILAWAPAMTHAGRSSFITCQSALITVRVGHTRDRIGRAHALAPTQLAELDHAIRFARKLIPKQRRPKEFRVTLDLDANTPDLRMSGRHQDHFRIALHEFDHPSLGYGPGYTYAYGLQVAHEYMRGRSRRYDLLHERRINTPEDARLELLASICREAYAWIFTNLVYGSADVMPDAMVNEDGTATALRGFATAVQYTALRDHTLTKRAAIEAALQALAEHWEHHAAMIDLSPTPWLNTEHQVDFLEGTARGVTLPFANHDLTREFRRIGFRIDGGMVPGRIDTASPAADRSLSQVEEVLLMRDVVKDPGGTKNLETEYAIAINLTNGGTIRLPLEHAGLGDEDYEEYRVIPSAREMASWFGVESGAIMNKGGARLVGETSEGDAVHISFGP